MRQFGRAIRSSFIIIYIDISYNTHATGSEETQSGTKSCITALTVKTARPWLGHIENIGVLRLWIPIDSERPHFKCSNLHVCSITRRAEYRQQARAKLNPIAFAISLSSLGRRENLRPPTTSQQIHIVCSTMSLVALRIGVQVKRSAGDRQPEWFPRPCVPRI
jgi:hypothetical protein